MNKILKKKILLLVGLLFCITVGLSAQSKVYLLSVGIADYPGIENDLRLPDNDARTIKAIYDKHGNSRCMILTNSQATCDSILHCMKRLFAKAGSNDIVLLFFSGHGYKGGFCAYDGYLPYERIKKVFAKCASKNKMIFADACYSGKMRGGRNTSPGKISRANVMLFLSSRSNERSIESASMKNGFFTAALQRGLRGGADVNKDRRVTAKELFNYVSTTVKALSDDKQHPVMWGKFKDDMPVLIW